MQACVSMPQRSTERSWGRASSSCRTAGTMLKQVLGCGRRPSAPSSGTVGPRPCGYCSVSTAGTPSSRATCAEAGGQRPEPEGGGLRARTSGSECGGRYLEHAGRHRHNLWEIRNMAELLLHVTQEQDGRSRVDSAQAWPHSRHVLEVRSRVRQGGAFVQARVHALRSRQAPWCL